MGSATRVIAAALSMLLVSTKLVAADRSSRKSAQTLSLSLPLHAVKKHSQDGLCLFPVNLTTFLQLNRSCDVRQKCLWDVCKQPWHIWRLSTWSNWGKSQTSDWDIRPLSDWLVDETEHRKSRSSVSLPSSPSFKSGAFWLRSQCAGPQIRSLQFPVTSGSNSLTRLCWGWLWNCKSEAIPVTGRGVP
jgi:hypothetical protein